MHLQLQKGLQVFKNIYKYVHLIENFKQKINPDINQVTKKYYVLYAYIA